MNDAMRVSFFQCAGGLFTDGNGLFPGQCAAIDHRLEVRTFQILHSNEKLMASFTDRVNGTDVGVIQGGCGLRFTQQTGAATGIRTLRRGNEFQGNGTPELGVYSAIDDTHSSLAKLLFDSIT
jgi:hypothetical protein